MPVEAGSQVVSTGDEEIRGLQKVLAREDDYGAGFRGAHEGGCLC